MANNITIFEVPTEAGTHWAGQHQAPEALKKAGLQDKLTASGYNVKTELVLKDGPAHWQPAPLKNGIRNEDNALTVLKELKSSLEAHLDTSTFPIVIGGDCSLTMPCMSAFSHLHSDSRVGLMYVDNDADLTLPSETGAPGSTGILDSMTLSNLTQRLGCLDSAKHFNRPDGSATVNSENIVAFGLDLTQPNLRHFGYLLDNHFRCFSSFAVQQAPLDSAESALSWLEQKVDKFWLHLDIDVVDSAQFPLGNFPSYGGIGFDEVMSAVTYFLQSAKVAGMSLTEVNPNNDPSGDMVQKLVDRLATAFEKRLKQ